MMSAYMWEAWRTKVIFLIFNILEIGTAILIPSPILAGREISKETSRSEARRDRLSPSEEKRTEDKRSKQWVRRLQRQMKNGKVN